MKVDLKSSVEKQGKTVTQIVTGLHGTKKTFRGVISSTIEQGQFTHFDTEDGRHVMINDKNVLWVEVFKEVKQVKQVSCPLSLHDRANHLPSHTGQRIGVNQCDDGNCPICGLKI